MRLCVFWALCVATVVEATKVCAQEALERATEPPLATVTRTDQPPTIDGRLDEAVWRDAVAFDAFTQIEPVEGAAPTQRTEVRVLYDARNLYVGVRCFDSDAGGIIARQMARDGDLGDDDHVSIVLDTFMDRRNGYVFMLGAAGGKRDGLIRGTRVERDWDGIWYGKATRDDAGWTAEFAIPTQTVAFDPRLDRWGFNVERVIRRNNEVVRWASPRREVDIESMGAAGTAAGLEDLTQGIGLTVTPFAVATADFDSGDADLEPGLDVFYQITPSVVASLTINTDFAETEVDDRQINLTRFPLFFPEKRDFFLQDAGLFRFGGIRRSPLPFHSRRIGIVGGSEKEILAGLKVTGRQDRVSFGLLDVQMKNDAALGDKNLFAGRVAVDVLKESTVGLIATNGDPGGRGQNMLLGWDFHYHDSDAGGAVLDGDAWVQATRSSPVGEPDETDTAFGGRFRYEADPWEFSLFAAQIGEDFQPALGFVRRVGVREYNVNGEYTIRPHGGTGFLRSIELEGRLGLFTDLNDSVETVSLDAPSVTLLSEAGDFARFELELEREVLDAPFTISPGIVVPVGTFDTYTVSASVGTSSSRAIAGSASIGYGTFWGGTRLDWGAGVSFQPSALFTFTADFEHNEIRLPQGDFDVQILSARATFQFSPEVTWANLVQWDNESDEAGFNSRLRWEFEPGREMFIVYNAGFDTANAWATTQSEMAVKIGWTWRF